MADLEAEDRECANGRTAPRVSLDDIEDAIAGTYYVTGTQACLSMIERQAPRSRHKALDYLTVCFIVLQNGFTIVGKAAPASPENFDADLGCKLAYEDAIRQIWPLMGFALRDRLHNGAAS